MTMIPAADSAPWTRRRFMAGVAGGMAAIGTGRAWAAEALEVGVPHAAFGAVVAAIGGDDIIVRIDASLPLVTLAAGDTQLSLAERLLLKGEGDARRRFLDDARNAPKLGAAVRDALRTVWPQHGDAFEQRHKTWSHSLVRDVLGWSQALSELGLRDKRVRDPDGRIYLLEWAGATVTSDGAKPPAGLASAPTEPSAATPTAYREYIEALVDALQ